MSNENPNNQLVILSREVYEKIILGVDLRKMCSEIDFSGTNDLNTEKIGAAMMLISFMTYPLATTASTIWSLVNSLPYVNMDDDAFRECVKVCVLSKFN